MPAHNVSGMSSTVVRLHVDETALSADQRTLLDRHAGTARAVWNWALAGVNAHQDRIWTGMRERAHAEVGGDDAAARELTADRQWRSRTRREIEAEVGRRPTSVDLGKAFTAGTRNANSRFAWWAAEKHGVNRFVVSSALRALDTAIDRFYKVPAPGSAGRRPRRDGRPTGWPRFKRKARDREAFALFNIAVTDPWKPIQEGHRLLLPSLGSIRTLENTRRLRRLIQRGGHPKSARFVRAGGRWMVAVVVTMPATAAAEPTRRQRAAGTVGVDLGVKALATLSDGTTIANRAPLRVMLAEKRRLARRLDRHHRTNSPGCFTAAGTHVKGHCAWRGSKDTPSRMSRSARTTARQLARLDHRVAVIRKGVLHQLTKQLATGYQVVAVEDLNVAGMLARPRPKPDGEGGFARNGRAAKRGLSLSIADVGFAEFRRQLQYKTTRYGSTLKVVDRWAPTSKTCSNCGAVKPKLPLAVRVFECDDCGLVIDRDHNAARNIRALTDAPPTECRTTTGAGAGSPTRQQPEGNTGSTKQTGSPPVAAASNGPPTHTNAA